MKNGVVHLCFSVFIPIPCIYLSMPSPRESWKQSRLNLQYFPKFWTTKPKKKARKENPPRWQCPDHITYMASDRCLYSFRFTDHRPPENLGRIRDTSGIWFALHTIPMHMLRGSISFPFPVPFFFFPPFFLSYLILRFLYSRVETVSRVVSQMLWDRINVLF